MIGLSNSPPDERQVKDHLMRCIVCGGDHQPSANICDSDGMDREAARMGSRKWNAKDSGDVVVSARDRGRHYDIIQEALESYRSYMLDDDFNAQVCLDKIMARMKERVKMSDPPDVS